MEPSPAFSFQPFSAAFALFKTQVGVRIVQQGRFGEPFHAPTRHPGSGPVPGPTRCWAGRRGSAGLDPSVCRRWQRCVCGGASVPEQGERRGSEDLGSHSVPGAQRLLPRGGHWAGPNEQEDPSGEEGGSEGTASQAAGTAAAKAWRPSLLGTSSGGGGPRSGPDLLDARRVGLGSTGPRAGRRSMQDGLVTRGRGGLRTLGRRAGHGQRWGLPAGGGPRTYLLRHPGRAEGGRW